jgi:hypothetical protein
MMRARDLPVVGHADQYDAAMTVRETNDRVHQLLIGERVILLGDELGGELFAARYESANLGIGEHDGAREIEGATRAFASCEASRRVWQATRSHDPVNPARPSHLTAA